jgi:putative hydrolase of the HAD superfamily
MGHLKNKQQLFFDLDDTLWDFEANSTRVLTELFLEHQLANKLKVDADEFLKQYYRINLELWTKLYRREIDESER